jgi:LysM repeat protein
MKKILYVAAVLLAALVVVSCATTAGGKPDDDFSQQEVDAAFDKVYETYADALIMEGAVDYTVVKGDTLTKIAGNKYQESNMFYFPLIMLASKDIAISDPDLIEPGMQLKIPDLQRNLSNSGSKEKIKAYLGDVAFIYEKKGTKKAALTAEKLRALAYRELNS